MNTVSTHPSIIWFTVHKSASVFIAGLLKNLAQESGMNYRDYEGNFWQKGEHFFQEIVVKNPQKVSEYFRSNGEIYGPFRGFIPTIKNMENYKKFKLVLMLRDPRDVMTSLYFSSAYSHGIQPSQKQAIQAVRKLALESNIDDYVVKYNKSFLSNYNLYCRELLGESNVLLVTYEEMVNNFSAWLRTVIDFFQIEVSQGFIESLVKEVEFDVSQENVYAHKRQVKPGDHRRKLKVTTIRQLNLEFEHILKRLNYLSHGSVEEFSLNDLVLHKSQERLALSQVKLQHYQNLLSQYTHV